MIQISPYNYDIRKHTMDFIDAVKKAIGKKDTVTVEIWLIKVYDGIYGYTRGEYSIIRELYIPLYNMAFNLDTDSSKLNIVTIGNGSHRYSTDNGATLLEKREISQEEFQKLDRIYDLDAELKREKGRTMPLLKDILGVKKEEDADGAN